MRSRERLIDVLASVNGSVVSLYTADIMQEAGKILAGRSTACPFEAVSNIETEAIENRSPHIRELARQAQYYILEDLKHHG